SKKERLNIDEKRKRLTEIFHETKDFFLLKDLEKIAPKSKGIVEKSVKEVLESLVADNIVNSEKIGTSIYYWSFPGQSFNSKKRKLEQLDTEVASIKQRKIELEKSIIEIKQGREDS
ncbi:Meiotic nuclear division protein 1, partial [Nowakowskiella sp. JEL0407]